MVSIDTGATRAFVGTAQQVAQGLNVKLDTLFIPPDTTDFAPVAAQIAERKPSALGLILTTQMVPFFNALADEQISPHDIPTFTAVTLMAPEVLHQLGDKADGVYLLTQQAPPSDKDNPGIQQMLEELKDAGFNANGDELSPAVDGRVGERPHARRHPQEAPASGHRVARLDEARRCHGEGRSDQPSGDRAVRLHRERVPGHRLALGVSPLHQTGDGHEGGGREVRPSVCLRRRDEAVQARELTVLVATEFLSQSTLRFVLLGMATGALTALVALSIVIVYRVSGVLNFSAAALGAVGAFVCYSLRDDHGWPVPLALGAGLLVGVALGMFTYAVMALLRETSLLSRLIATLALLSAAQSAMLVLWSNQLSAPRSLLPDRSIVIAGDLRISQDRLILIGVVLVLAVGLRAVYSGTLFGLATSAVSENRRVAAIARWAPNRIEFVNYLIGGFLSALAAILLAPIVGLNATILSIAILPALAAALVGRFSSFALTVAAALLIGVIQSELSLFQPDLAHAFGVSTASLTGLTEAVPLIIILIVTVFSGRARPTRGETAARLPLPGSGKSCPAALRIGDRRRRRR